MILKVLAVFDSKAGFFGQPFFEQREAAGVRAFGDAVNDSSNPANQWNKHPEDFQLFMIGEFDNESGELIPSLPKALISAASLHRGQGQLDLFEKNGVKDKAPVN